MAENHLTIKPSTLFRDAAPKWLENHSIYIEKRTVRDYREAFVPLNRIFGRTPLNKITLTAIREYQSMRQKGDRRTGASKPICNEGINKELGTLRQILKEAGLWAKFEPMYKQLPINREGSGTSINADEEKILMEIVFSRPTWITKAHCLRIMLKTGCGFGELRSLRRKDIDIENAQITISHEGAKNYHRQRTIPLIPEALESVQWLIARWTRLGGRSPEQYILPIRKGRHGRVSLQGHPWEYDLSRPAGESYLTRHWREIRAEAIARIGPKMKKFRVYDCRVTAITRTLSDGRTPIYAAQRVFGHVSREMENRYFKPDNDVLRKTLSALETSREKVFDVAEKTSSAIGSSIGALIEQLKRVGLPPEKILDVISGLQKPAAHEDEMEMVRRLR